MAPTPITPAELWAVLMAISNNIMATGFGQLGHIDPSIPSHITIGGHRFAQELLAANEQQRATRAGWAKLSTEVKSKIFKFAMTAEGKSINLPCLSNAAYKPNIAVGLLSVK